MNRDRERESRGRCFWLGGKPAENGGSFARKAADLTGGGFFTLKLIRLMFCLDCVRFEGQRFRVASGQ